MSGSNQFILINLNIINEKKINIANYFRSTQNNFIKIFTQMNEMTKYDKESSSNESSKLTSDWTEWSNYLSKRRILNKNKFMKQSLQNALNYNYYLSPRSFIFNVYDKRKILNRNRRIGHGKKNLLSLDHSYYFIFYKCHLYHRTHFNYSKFFPSSIITIFVKNFS